MSTDALPPPPVPADCDLRGMLFMPLDVQRLLDSDLFINATGDEFKAAVALWCKSWSQVPAASLPDDDRALAHYSRAGSKWARIKAVAMSGWIKASDGRLYHPVVAEKAIDAWEARVNQRARTEAARLARAASRNQQARHATDTVTGSATGSVTENVTASKGQGQGQGQYTPPPPAAASAEDMHPQAPAQAQPAAAPMSKSWMDWRLEVGRHRVFLDRQGNAETHWAELYNRAGWDEFTAAWEYCAARTTKPGGKVFLANMLEVLK